MKEHVNLAAGRQLGTSNAALDAANAAYHAGGSPRAQIDAAREATKVKSIRYLPHVGAKQRAKAARRAG